MGGGGEGGWFACKFCFLSFNILTVFSSVFLSCAVQFVH